MIKQPKNLTKFSKISCQEVFSYLFVTRVKEVYCFSNLVQYMVTCKLVGQMLKCAHTKVAMVSKIYPRSEVKVIVLVSCLL